MTERHLRHDSELSPRQAEALLRMTETAPGISTRPQFFVWSQGPLHALLPHRTLVCGSWLRHKRALDLTVFHSVVVSQQGLSSLSDPDSPVMVALATRWMAAEGPVALSSGALEGAAREQSESLLQQIGCEHWLVHGVTRPERRQEIESLFVAAAEPSAYETHEWNRLLNIALPGLHATWRRVQPTTALVASPRADGGMAGAGSEAVRVQLTDREREILRLAQGGLTNAAIGAALNISPLTVKNHVQKVLRKFKARNRAQAVALAMSQGLLARDPEAAR